ncbi:UNVERIFIED_ORG: glycine/D-amino acid oxidase-like deaminating enzyme, partial [Herbaspirillum seropedicae]
WDMKGRTTAWPPLVDGGRWVKWRGSNPRANQHIIDQNEPMSACSAGNAGYLSEANIFPPASLDILKQLPQLMLAKDSPLIIQPTYLPQLLRWALPALKFNNEEKLNDIATSMASLLRVAYSSFDELVTAADATHLLDRKGGLVAYKTEAALEKKSKNVGLWNSHGLNAEIVSSEDVSELEPALAPMAGGVYFPNAGRCLNPKSLGEHYFRRLLGAGARFVRRRVKAIDIGAENRPIVHFADEEEAFSKIVISTGFDKGLLQKFVNFNIPMVAERGYHLMLPSPGVQLSRPIVFGEPMFAATSMEHGLRLAGTAEFAFPTREPNMERSFMLLQMAKGYIPQLSGEGAKPWMGVRPTLPDGRPAFGAVPDAPNVFYALGHGHNGLTTSAITAFCVSSLVREATPPLNVQPFVVERFH